MGLRERSYMRIGRQQTLQKGCARTRAADDKYPWKADLVALDLFLHSFTPFFNQLPRTCWIRSCNRKMSPLKRPLKSARSSGDNMGGLTTNGCLTSPKDP